MPIHTTTARRSTSDRLPHSVQHYLDGNVPQGQRNRALLDSACQLRDIGMPEGEAMDLLGERTRADGAPDSELQSTVASAYSRPPREAPTGSTAAPAGASRVSSRSYILKRGTRMPEAPAAPRPSRSVALPEPVEGGFVELLKVAFKEGEGVCIAPGVEMEDSGKVIPKGSGITLDRENWISSAVEKGDFAKVMGCKQGVFLRVNPMRIKGKGADSDVTDLRHLLVEFDLDSSGNPIPKEQQYAAIIDSHLPVTAVLDSANKSIHAWVRVSAKDKAQYDARAELVYARFEGMGLDTCNKNPSRFSRAPDGKRTVDGEIVRQRLLKVGMGASSWEDYEKLGGGKDVLGEPVTLASLVADHPTPPPFIIDGVASIGDKIILTGPSKAGKTFAMLGLAAAVIAGGDWMGRTCRQGKVLLLNFEVKEGWLAERARSLIAAGVDVGEVEVLNLRGKRSDTDDIIDSLGWKANMGKKYSLIIIDPLYKLLDDEAEENSNSDMAKLMDQVEAMADKSGAAVVFAHHYSKGNKSATAAVDRMSGGGVLARDPDAIITLTEHEEDACFALECTTRNYAKPAPVVVEFSYPVFHPRPDLDAGDLLKPGGGRKAKTDSGTSYSMGKKDPGGRPSTFTDEQKEELQSILDDNDGCLPMVGVRHQIAEMWGIKPNTLLTYLKRMGAKPTKPNKPGTDDEQF